MSSRPLVSRSAPVAEPALLIRTVTSPVGLCGGLDGGGVGDVERDRLRAGEVDLDGVAGAGVDGGAAAEQFGGECPAEPSVGSGDEDGACRDVHGRLLVSWKHARVDWLVLAF